MEVSAPLLGEVRSGAAAWVSLVWGCGGVHTYVVVVTVRNPRRCKMGALSFGRDGRIRTGGLLLPKLSRAKCLVALPQEMFGQAPVLDG